MSCDGRSQSNMEMSTFSVYTRIGGETPLLVTIFPKNQRKVLETVLRKYDALCSNKYPRTSVPCKVIMKVEKLPIQVNFKTSKHNVITD